MVLKKRLRKMTLMLAVSVVFTIAMVGCNKEEASTSEPEQPAEVEEAGEVETPVDPNEVSLSEEETKLLEQASAKDAEKYLDALKQQDTKTLSTLMIYAENEYTVEDMAKVLEGFLLYFDSLEELQLNFTANEQDDKYYVENFTIAGTKNSKTRAIPFQVKYAKSQGMEQIQDDIRREPLFDSPLIGEYPYAVQEVERYVKALQEKDTASLALHLGMYDDNEETKESAERTLQKYTESLDLSSIKVVSKGYDEQAGQYHFELRDDNRQTHELLQMFYSEGSKIVDDWSIDQTAD